MLLIDVNYNGKTFDYDHVFYGHELKATTTAQLGRIMKTANESALCGLIFTVTNRFRSYQTAILKKS